MSVNKKNYYWAFKFEVEVRRILTKQIFDNSEFFVPQKNRPIPSFREECFLIDAKFIEYAGNIFICARKACLRYRLLSLSSLHNCSVAMTFRG